MQDKKKQVSVIVPAFNEEKAISGVVNELRQALTQAGWTHEILVVDDGSADQTAAAARACGAQVLTHPKNAGYGAALRTGIENASHELVATIDADLSYPPKEINKILEEAHRFDMVIGARGGRHYWGNMIKHPARLLFLALAQFVVGEKIPDANSGLRVFKKTLALKMLPRLCRGFSFSTTLTLSFMSRHYFVHFIPIAYTARIGTSKVSYVRDTLRTLQLLLETIIYYNPIKASLLLLAPTLLGSAICFVFYIGSCSIIWLLTSVFLLSWSLLLLSLGFILFMLAQGRYPE